MRVCKSPFDLQNFNQLSSKPLIAWKGFETARVNCQLTLMPGNVALVGGHSPSPSGDSLNDAFYPVILAKRVRFAWHPRLKETYFGTWKLFSEQKFKESIFHDFQLHYFHLPFWGGAKGGSWLQQLVTLGTVTGLCAALDWCTGHPSRRGRYRMFHHAFTMLPEKNTVSRCSPYGDVQYVYIYHKKPSCVILSKSS